jgi:hypothetical protein
MLYFSYFFERWPNATLPHLTIYRVAASTVLGYPNPITCILYGLLDTGDSFCHFALAQLRKCSSR